MIEQLEPIEILRCLTETYDEFIARRGRTTTDLIEKGTPFEKWIIEQIESKTTATVTARNQWLGIIKPKEYNPAKKTYSHKLAKLHDIGLTWNGKLHIVIEAGYRKSFYFNAYTLPQCDCTEWDENSTHISLPHFDIDRYRQNYNRLRKIPTYIFIGKPMKIFAIVKLKEWLQTAFADYNESLFDNQKQSVICLKQTRHYTDLDEWIKKMKMPLT